MRKLPLLLSFLAGASAAGLALHGSRPPSSQAADPRTPVALSADERVALLRHMRQALQDVQLVLASHREAERTALLAALERLAESRPAKANPELFGKLPQDWFTLASGMHEGFGRLRDELRAGASPDLPGRMALLLRSCVACHERYRLPER